MIFSALNAVLQHMIINTNMRRIAKESVAVVYYTLKHLHVSIVDSSILYTQSYSSFASQLDIGIQI